MCGLAVCVSINNGGCSSMVEPRIVIPVVVGSSPISHPKVHKIAMSKARD